ncbi:MAG TPA: helix-turn-helix transcriptional regulator [Thermoleophilaceae bacterium]|nr:helix-turn-helix transcriptional regulator [Thermoleophilaceae bacterium]
MSRDARLTPFSYLILALVGRNGAGPHDIVRMMREGSIFWTTSESHYYAEPKRLATLGFLHARTEPGRTRPRTHYELTDTGRRALEEWLARPAAMPRIQHEGVVKLLAADLSDDATIQASLAGLRSELDRAYQNLDVMERRAPSVPHRTRYLKLINDYGRRSLDAQREWLDAVQEALDRPSGDAETATG